MTADFTGFHEREAPRLVRSVTLVTGDAAPAEDAVAEAFARACVIRFAESVEPVAADDPRLPAGSGSGSSLGSSGRPVGAEQGLIDQRSQERKKGQVPS